MTPTQERMNTLWHRAMAAGKAGAWDQAEGWLRLLVQMGLDTPELQVLIGDALGHALLVQGEHRRCEAVLRPLLEIPLPPRTFWVSHKLADALRGQRRLEEALVLYRQCMAEGSTSHYTFQNHLETVEMHRGGSGVAQLEQWLGAHAAAHPCWQGANLAACRAPDQGLIDWLVAHNRGSGASRRRWIERRMYRLDLAAVATMLNDSQQSSPWEQRLQQRLVSLGVQTPG